MYAVERADRTAIAGLAESLDGYLLDALYGPKTAASMWLGMRNGYGTVEFELPVCIRA